MKKLAALLLSLMISATPIMAAEGEMGSFGGISTGVKMDTLTALKQESKKSNSSKVTLPYKENVYLSGAPETAEGTIEFKPGIEIDKEAGTGSYTESYKMTAQNASGSTKVIRNITFETKYIYEEDRKQATKTTTVKKWSEVITSGGVTYKLDQTKSNFTKSVLEDYTPGVLYYRGDVNYTAVYDQAGGDDQVTVTVVAPIYGYDQAYAKSETQRRTITVNKNNGEGYAITETPTMTVYRDIEYGSNEPTAISMAGNYKEIVKSEGVLSYDVLQGNSKLEKDEAAGMVSVAGPTSVDQLSIPSQLNLHGHPATTQIRKMYSMKIFDMDPAKFSTNEAVRKRDYIKMLVKALQIEIPDTTAKKSSKETPKSEVTGVSINDPIYPYMLAALRSGLISKDSVAKNSYLTREEMYVFNVRAIGLERLGLVTLDKYTTFCDDNKISSWAKSSVYAAYKIGLINTATDYVYPQKEVTMAECATFLDQLMSYLRYDLQKDYTDKMLMA